MLTRKSEARTRAEGLAVSPNSPTPPGQTDLARLFAFLQQFTNAAYPGHHGATLEIKLADGRPAVLPIPPAPPVAAALPAPADDALNAMEQAIVEVIDGLEESATLTGEEVAERAGYPFNGRFRETIARLVRNGRIKNKRPGYGRA